MLFGLAYIVWFVLCVYPIGMLMLGWYSKKSIKDQEGCLPGNRKFGVWMMIMHAFGADPKMIERGDWEGVEHAVRAISEKAGDMKNFVWGCGCVSYNTSEENVHTFKELCLKYS